MQYLFLFLFCYSNLPHIFQIEIAYAGPPGYSSYSLDVPRKMTSLVLTLFHGWNLEAALSTPIVSYYRDAFVEYLGFPYVRLLSLLI